MLTLDVCKSLKKAAIPYIVEMNVENLFVDILIPKSIENKKVILDIHGY